MVHRQSAEPCRSGSTGSNAGGGCRGRCRAAHECVIQGARPFALHSRFAHARRDCESRLVSVRVLEVVPR